MRADNVNLIALYARVNVFVDCIRTPKDFRNAKQVLPAARVKPMAIRIKSTILQCRQNDARLGGSPLATVLILMFKFDQIGKLIESKVNRSAQGILDRRVI